MTIDPMLLIFNFLNHGELCRFHTSLVICEDFFCLFGVLKDYQASLTTSWVRIPPFKRYPPNLNVIKVKTRHNLHFLCPYLRESE